MVRSKRTYPHLLGIDLEGSFENRDSGRRGSIHLMSNDSAAYVLELLLAGLPISFDCLYIRPLETEKINGNIIFGKIAINLWQEPSAVGSVHQYQEIMRK